MADTSFIPDLTRSKFQVVVDRVLAEAPDGTSLVELANLVKRGVDRQEVALDAYRRSRGWIEGFFNGVTQSVDDNASGKENPTTLDNPVPPWSRGEDYA